jgi:hypothetical protein
MDKRLMKRHKRQVLRAKEHKRLSEPDIRTPEQVKAARDASRATLDRKQGPYVSHSAPSRNETAPAAGGAAQTDDSPSE